MSIDKMQASLMYLVLVGLFNGVMLQHADNYAAPVKHESYAAPPKYSSPAARYGYVAPAKHEAYAAPAKHEAYAAPAKHEGYAAPAKHEGYEYIAPAKHEAFEYAAPAATYGYAAPLRHEGYAAPVKHEGYAAPVYSPTKYANPDLEYPTAYPKPYVQSTYTNYVTYTPTVTETVFDLQTTTTGVHDTHTITDLKNVNVINTEWEVTTVKLQATSTSRHLTPVKGQDITNYFRSTNTQVYVTTEVLPTYITESFYKTVTSFVTRYRSKHLSSILTHSKCYLEISTVPKYVHTVVTQTAHKVITSYYTSTVIVTSVYEKPGYY